MSYRHNDGARLNEPRLDYRQSGEGRDLGQRDYRDAPPPRHRRSRSPVLRHPRDRRDYRGHYDEIPRPDDRYNTAREAHRPREEDPIERNATYRRREDRINKNGPSRSARDNEPRGHVPPPRRSGMADEKDIHRRIPVAFSETASPTAQRTESSASVPDGGEGPTAVLDADAEEEDAMMKAMGFGGFGTTKGTKVKGNQTGLAEVKKERTWRQYMQRKGGFNRPLSPVRK